MRWPAPTERPWALHGKRKRHFSEFSSEAARSDGGGIPAAATPTHGEQARPGGAAGEASAATPAAGEASAATPATGFHRLFLCFSFLGEGGGDPLLLLPGPLPCVLARPRGTSARGTGTGCGRTKAAQREASDGGQQTARQAHRSKGPEKALRSAVCDRCGDRWSRPRYRHRHTRANERQRAALCGPVRRTRLGSGGAGAVAAPHGAPPAARAQGLAARICRLLF